MGESLTQLLLESETLSLKIRESLSQNPWNALFKDFFGQFWRTSLNAFVCFELAGVVLSTRHGVNFSAPRVTLLVHPVQHLV